MAIYSSVPPPEQPAAASAGAGAGVDIESGFSSLKLSSPKAAKLSIPLDGETAPRVRKDRDAAVPGVPERRDSQKRRDALLKGKEGSRRRQRWENDHLLHVPNAQPPLPQDWQVHSTSPINHVPYFLAPLWENGVRRRAEEIASARTRASAERAGFSATTTQGRIPHELRQKLKKSKGAKTLLQELEEEVRRFVRDYERKERLQAGRVEDEVEVDSEDEEIVFVGRNGSMSDEQRKTVEAELQREKKVFDSLVGDQGGTFGRWLVHSIAGYYGLTSRSVTVGDPQRREAWVGMKTGRWKEMGEEGLPRPLWGMI